MKTCQISVLLSASLKFWIFEFFLKFHIWFSTPRKKKNLIKIAARQSFHIPSCPVYVLFIAKSRSLRVMLREGIISVHLICVFTQLPCGTLTTDRILQTAFISLLTYAYRLPYYLIYVYILVLNIPILFPKCLLSLQIVQVAFQSCANAYTCSGRERKWESGLSSYLCIYFLLNIPIFFPECLGQCMR